MSTFLERELDCPGCGALLRVVDCDGVNVERLPGARQALLDGEFMRHRCACGHQVVLDHRLLWMDLDLGLIAAVFSPSERDDSKVGEQEQVLAEALRQAMGAAPPPLPVARALTAARRRVVFGIEELREKVVCFAAGLSDHALEAMKLSLLDTMPLLRAAAARLSLQAVEADGSLWLAPLGLPEEGDGGKDLIRVGREVYQRFASDAQRLPLLLPELFQGAYVNAERCQ